jgi:hypothetical protein
MRRKLDIAAELRDSAESNRDHAFYEKYLSIFIPALITILGDPKSIVFVKENVEQVRMFERAQANRTRVLVDAFSALSTRPAQLFATITPKRDVPAVRVAGDGGGC